MPLHHLYSTYLCCVCCQNDDEIDCMNANTVISQIKVIVTLIGSYSWV